MESVSIAQRGCRTVSSRPIIARMTGLAPIDTYSHRRQTPVALCSWMRLTLASC